MLVLYAKYHVNIGPKNCTRAKGIKMRLPDQKNRRVLGFSFNP